MELKFNCFALESVLITFSLLMRFFGIVRSSIGGGDKPTCTSFLHFLRIFSLYYPVSAVLKGANVDDDEAMQILTSYKENLLARHRKTRAELLNKKKIKDQLFSNLCFTDRTVVIDDPKDRKQQIRKHLLFVWLFNSHKKKIVLQLR